ncbi:MAG: hypothetical protein Q9166_004093 [cf. Caloplaca sp. 2 TL-2023]
MLPSLCGSTQGHPPQKLSKPLTNTSSSNLLAPTRQALEPASPLATFDTDTADGYFPKMALNVERRERRNTRSKIRAYLYGPSPESGHSHSSEDEEHSPLKLANVARDVKRRLSRTESLSQKLTAGDASAASSTSHLHLTDASGSDLNEDEVIIEQIKEKVWIDSLAAQNHVSSPIDEDKHPDSVMSPIRRRSLYTPGIATRSPDDILRKPPPPELVRSQADRDYYYNPALPDSSPLSRLAHLGSPQNGRSTPSELDYGHLGALMLGTLRVTNGTASPAPQEQGTTAAPPSLLDTTSQDGYYTPSESGRSEADGCLTVGDLKETTLRTSQDDSLWTAASPVQTETNSLGQPSCISPGSEYYGQRGSRTGNLASLQSLTMSHKYIKRKPLPDPSPAIQRDEIRNGNARPMSEFHQSFYQSENRAYLHHNLLANQAVRKDTLSHTGFSPSKSQGHEPDIWRSIIPGADEPQTSDGSREDAFLKLTRNENAGEDSYSVADKPQEPRHHSALGNQHIDSGYSSNVSLESTQRPSTTAYLDSSAPSRSPRDMPSLSPRPFCNSAETRLGGNRLDSDQIQKNQDLISTDHTILDIPTEAIASTGLGNSSFATETKPMLATPSQKQMSSSERSRRLQKKRPKSQPPLQRTPLPADSSLSNTSIPPVPSVVAALHSERVLKFPLLEHTYSSLQHTDTEQLPISPRSTAVQTRFPSPTSGPEESLPRDRSSIFQKLASRARSRSRSRPKEPSTFHQSDDESVKSICRSPSWSEYGNKKRREERKRKKAERETQKHDSPTDADPRLRSRSRSRFRSRSRRRASQCESVPMLSDFGTVRESLGASPYDIATASRISNHPNQQPTGRQLQPYHVSTAKHHVDPKDAISVGPTERNRPRIHASATVPSNDDNQSSEDTPSKPVRPYSMYIDQRPIPAMAMADLAQSGTISQKTPNPLASQTRRLTMTTCQTPPIAPNPHLKIEYNLETTSSFEQKTEPEHAPRIGSLAETTDSMEELIDRLLDAPSPEAREITLEQIRQKRRRTVAEPIRPGQQANGDTAGSAGPIIGPCRSQESTIPMLDQSTSSTASTQARPTTTKPAVLLDGPGLAVSGQVYHDSMFVDAPPTPPVPTTESIQHQEARRSIGRSNRIKPPMPPQTQTSETTKADLWAGCAIQIEHRKAIESTTDWDAHRLAWSRRRKSAGEALLLKNKPFGWVSQTSWGDVAREPEQPSTVSRAMTAGSEQLPVPRKAFHKPWVPSLDPEICQSHTAVPSQPCNKEAAAAQAFERRSGRYEGGLLYGYEPGFGLGGSAGTRSTKTGATRKSLQMSQGFGVDLSDVPIFVAPSK